MSSRSPSEPQAPSLDFDWEEDLFTAVLGLFRKLAPKRELKGACHSQPHCERLTPLVRVISGLPLNVTTSKGGGGLRNNDVLVPTTVHLGEDLALNLAALTVHALMSAMMASLLSAPNPPAFATYADQLRLACAARDRLLEEWPKFAVLWQVTAAEAQKKLAGPSPAEEAIRQILSGQTPTQTTFDAKNTPRSPLWGQVFQIDQLGSGQALNALNQRSSQVTTEVQGKNPEDLRIVHIDEKKTAELPSHIFEKVETADDYRNEQRTTDGDDELDEHLDALEELDLNTMYRGGAPADSMYKADIRLAIDIPDVHHVAPSEHAIHYDEWDHKKGAYKKDWVQVFPTPVHAADDYAAQVASEKRAQIANLVRRLKNYRQQLRPHPRQLDGEDVDLEALVQETATRHAGHGGNARLYERRARTQRSHATTVLIDISLSSDSWVDNHRVLDIAREAVVVLGEVTDVLGDDLQVLAFASNTRNLVRVFEIKRWNDSWHGARRRLGPVEPQGYTRIGPALRHATHEVLAQPASKRMVLLLSDGKPTDYDRYEGNYGIQDVRQAVREANRAGVHVFGLAIDQTARNYLPAMLGDHNWALMPNAEALVTSLTDLYGRMSK